MISRFNEECLQTDNAIDRSPVCHVFSDVLSELYWSKNKLMRTLLRLENNAINGRLQRLIHDYFEVNRVQAYAIEHIFELLDENPKGRTCAMTEVSCRNALATLNPHGKSQGKDKAIRSCLAEFYAQEIIALEYLSRLSITLERTDVTRIISGMQQRTRDAFDYAFPATPNYSDVIA
jgi:ferritin-like metal-binding protein YciE